VRGEREQVHFPAGHSFRLLRWTEDVSHVDCLLSPTKAEPLSGEGNHWHFHAAMELTLFAAGTGTRFVGDHIGPFQSGDLVLLGENLPHYWHTRGSSRGLSVQWHFPQSHPFWAFPETLSLTGLFEKAGRGVRIVGATARETTRHLTQLAQSAGPARLAGLFALLGQLAEAPDSDCELLSRRSFVLSAESNYQAAISRAVRHLVAHFREEVGLEDLLLVTDMSRATFARQFKKHSGKTFSEFISQLRLQAACQELRETDRSVLDIASSAGFSQLSFFNRYFRREMGCSPTQYRQTSSR
jgi:AraC-like DNA-binding protein